MVSVATIVRSAFAAENSAHSLGAHTAANVHRTKCALDVWFYDATKEKFGTKCASFGRRFCKAVAEFSGTVQGVGHPLPPTLARVATVRDNL